MRDLALVGIGLFPGIAIGFQVGTWAKEHALFLRAYEYLKIFSDGEFKRGMERLAVHVWGGK